MYFALVLLLTGCSFFEPRDKEPKPERDFPAELKEQAALYCELSEPAYLEKKYVHSRCDGAGFTSLRQFACAPFGHSVDLQVFEDATGRMHRDPEHACFVPPDVDNGAASGFSKDMLLMRVVSAFAEHDSGWFERFSAFAESRDWVFCDAKDAITRISRCIATPSFRRLFRDSMRAVKGEHPLRVVENQFDPDGFEAHLQVLMIWLSGEVYGALTESEVEALGRQASREPNNALFQAVFHKYSGGDQQAAYSLLKQRFPPERLPNATDWCEEYIFQRSERDSNGGMSGDWLPCEPFSEHSGTDFGVTVRILSGQ